MKQLKLAFIGLGRVFNHYIDLILSDPALLERFQVIGLVDSDESLHHCYKDLTQKFSSNFYTSCESLLQHVTPDIAIICTPSGTHFDITKFFLLRHIAVLCEKPVSMKLSEAEILLSLSETNLTKYWAAFQNRFNPSVSFAKHFINSGMLGSFLTGSLVVRWSRDSRYYSSAAWRGTYKSDGGVINNQAIHHVDALTYLLESFSDIIAFKNNSFHKQLEVEDTMVGVLRHKASGNLLTLEMTTAIQHTDHQASISLFGENGYIQLGGIALNKLLDVHCYENNIDLSLACEQNSLEVSNGYGFGHRDLLHSIYDDFIGERESICRASSCKHTAQIINSAYLSHDTNWISTLDLRDNPVLG